MYMFLFENVEQLTNRWHSDGGLLIIAQDLDRAKQMVDSEEYILPTAEEWDGVIVHKLDGDYPEALYTFPDAGCC